MSQNFLRLFSPTEININETNSLKELVNEFERINSIYISDFIRCKNELKDMKLDSLIDELYILSYEQSYNLKLVYNQSNCHKDLNLKNNVKETIHKLDSDYRKMILDLYLPE